MEGTAILNEATAGLSTSSGLWCLDKLPLGTLIMGDVGLYVLLNFTGRNRFFDLEDVLMGLTLLLVSVVTVTHARIACLLVFHRNHVLFAPFFFECRC